MTEPMIITGEMIRELHIIPFPYNLYEFMRKAVKQYWKDEDITLDSVYESISELTPRERKVLYLRYKDEKTLQEIGVECGVTAERIRQINSKALRKLTSPSRLYNHRVVPRQLYVDAKAEACRLSLAADGPLAQPVDYLDLSVRSSNCLKRHGCDSVEDVLNISILEELLRIRNLGRKSAEEIINKIHDLGLKMAWES